MTITADHAFLTGLDAFAAVVDRVGPDAWGEPSQCEGWSNLDVLGHVGNAMNMGIDILHGRQPTFSAAEHPGEGVDAAPADYWASIAASARDAVDGVDLDEVVDSPRGPRSIGDGLSFPAIDLFVHAWDIGHAVGLPVEIPGDVIEFAQGVLAPIPSDMMRGEGKPFGAELDAPADATASEAFLAWTGRSPR